ncbi:MAG: PEP-CTERM sorting domain-containing protein [Verrucomicrobiota bacterium]
MKNLTFAAVWLVLAGTLQAAVTISGNSLNEITDRAGNPAATYEIGYFASDAVPSSPADWGTFVAILGVGPKDIGVVDQTGAPTFLPGQFAFDDEFATRADIGLTSAGDYVRRLGIRFFDSTGQESNIVSAANTGWVLNDPESLLAGPAALTLADSDIVWQFPGSAFQTIPEPSSGLLLLGAGGLLMVRRKRSLE